uniref:Serologically defined colon cancer antigen 8 n=1 Tax=Sphaeramia orbicularis TaxID=375764 RepID=A0A673BU51_9TELE
MLLVLYVCVCVCLLFIGVTVNQLKSLLLKQCKEMPAPLSPSKKHSPSKRVQHEGQSSLPAFQDLVPMVHNQSEYIQHLEAEVKFCKEELQGMKQRVRVVVVENEKLSSELKSRAADDSLKITLFKTQWYCVFNFSQEDRLKVIYQAQIESLETQVISLRKDLSVSQRECEEVKVRLKHKEKQVVDAVKADGVPRVAGLCLKCAQHEAVLAGTHTNVHVQAIERLTKSRDELLVALRAVRTSHQEAQQREWTACLQVKQAAEMAEEANLHKARVEVHCEQLSRELSRLREQQEKEAQVLKERLSQARDEGRTESRKHKEQLAHTVSNLSQRVAELEGQLDRANRDKTSLTNQLDDTVHRLTTQEQDSTKILVDLRYQLSQAQLKKEEAERELRELTTKTKRQIEKAAQEVERLSSELVGCRQHLEAVQKDGSQWQSEALSLAEQLANAQRQLHLTRYSRAGWFAEFPESLIRKLKEECCTLGAALEERTENSSQEETVFSHSFSQYCVCVCVCVCVCCRLQQLDRHCQSSAQQVCELLAKQNQLMQERNTLTEEMQNLRRLSK